MELVRLNGIWRLHPDTHLIIYTLKKADVILFDVKINNPWTAKVVPSWIVRDKYLYTPVDIFMYACRIYDFVCSLLTKVHTALWSRSREMSRHYHAGPQCPVPLPLFERLPLDRSGHWCSRTRSTALISWCCRWMKRSIGSINPSFYFSRWRKRFAEKEGSWVKNTAAWNQSTHLSVCQHAATWAGGLDETRRESPAKALAAEQSVVQAHISSSFRARTKKQVADRIRG